MPGFWLINFCVREVKVSALVDILFMYFFAFVNFCEFVPIKVFYYVFFPNLFGNDDVIEEVGASLFKGVEYVSDKLPPEPLGMLESYELYASMSVIACVITAVDGIICWYAEFNYIMLVLSFASSWSAVTNPIKY